MLNSQTHLVGGRLQRILNAPPETLEIAIGTEGRITAIGSNLERPQGTRVVDLAGKLVLPGFVDAHQHLDKSRTRRLVSNPTNDLAGALSGYRRFAKTVTREDIVARAEQTIRECLSRGTVAIRSHTNIDPETELRGVEAMLEVRERWADRCTLQVVAHVTSDATRMHDKAKEWLHAAADAGVDAIGGVPAISDRPVDFLNMLFDVAEKTGRPLDLHMDEHLDADRHLFGELIERTHAHGMHGRVTAGHSSVLSALDSVEAQRIAEALATAGIAVVTLPAANLFLQGRSSSVLPPRGLTRVRELIAAGVAVAAASDNVQDPFVPVGSGDMLEVARWTMLAAHLELSDLSTAYDLVSRVPASIMGLGANWGLHPGAWADLVILDAEDAEDAVASGALHRTVFVRGRQVGS